MTKPVKDLPASIRHKLTAHAQHNHMPVQAAFEQYAIHRFLFRLSRSKHASDFIIKGGQAFQAWGLDLRRPTRDIDLHAINPDLLDRLPGIIKTISTTQVQPDGLVFNHQKARFDQIDADAQGTRIKLTANLGEAVIPVRIDISQGNVITPSPQRLTYAEMVGMAPPTLLCYPPETSIAEKTEAMVSLGLANGRVRDYYDVWLLSQDLHFDGQTLVDALIATFARRATPLPQVTPDGLTDDYAHTYQTEWTAFLRTAQQAPAAIASLTRVLAVLRTFLNPLFHAGAAGQRFPRRWSPGGPWKPS